MNEIFKSKLKIKGSYIADPCPNRRTEKFENERLMPRRKFVSLNFNPFPGDCARLVSSPSKIVSS